MKYSAAELEQWSSGKWVGRPPDKVAGVCQDSRTIVPGELYVAIRGEQFDGHRFIVAALSKGAAGAMVERVAFNEGGVVGDGPWLVVADSVKALGQMGQAYRRKVNPLVVGITGSVGKTTVKEMTASVFGRAMPTARTKGNWNNEIGLPLSLLAMDSDARAGVFEVGMNHPGEIAELCEILQPVVGIVTAIGPAHIEFFESVEKIAEEKAALLTSLPTDGVAVLWREEAYFEKLRGMTPCAVKTVSLRPGQGDYYARFDREAKMLIVTENETGDEARVNWSIPGDHNVLNAAYAVAAARSNGIGWQEITTGLEKYRPLPMRWEVEMIGGVKFINDAYNANPVSMREALLTFNKEECEGNKWLVLGTMYELGASARDEHFELGRFTASGDWDGVIAVGEFAEDVIRGLRAEGFPASDLRLCEDNRAAVEVLAEVLTDGDSVLLKASRGAALEEIISALKKEVRSD